MAFKPRTATIWLRKRHFILSANQSQQDFLRTDEGYQLGGGSIMCLSCRYRSPPSLTRQTSLVPKASSVERPQLQSTAGDEVRKVSTHGKSRKRRPRKAAGPQKIKAPEIRLDRSWCCLTDKKKIMAGGWAKIKQSMRSRSFARQLRWNTPEKTVIEVHHFGS